MRVGIVGATGIVGRELLELLAAGTSIRISELRLSASPRSAGKKLMTAWGELTIRSLDEEFFCGLDLCFFCTGKTISARWVPAAVARGVRCLDNSSAFRMQEGVPVIVPEVNGNLLSADLRLVANPNCCVAQLTPVLHPVKVHFGLEEVTVSTYQAVSGAGQDAMEQMARELAQHPRSVGAGQLLFNLIPYIGRRNNAGHSEEEEKIVRETRKILELPTLPMAVTAVRVPVMRGHALAVTFKTRKEAVPEEIGQLLSSAPNLRVVDAPQPIVAQHTNAVYVGRIRSNSAFAHRSFSLWIVADNLRTGAAHNALKTAEAWCRA
ncbi:MAG TPA: aspartate-semialdehyde dehydrogenase [Bacillota bacterium]|nr:aspartate-semialdehyde dehydrogenase [Bacillota bacterium]HQE01039.1 aspartate-semialdehyde dehydrogenase [Bacillota bacterium]